MWVEALLSSIHSTKVPVIRMEELQQPRVMKKTGWILRRLSHEQTWAVSVQWLREALVTQEWNTLSSNWKNNSAKTADLRPKLSPWRRRLSKQTFHLLPMAQVKFRRQQVDYLLFRVFARLAWMILRLESKLVKVAFLLFTKVYSMVRPWRSRRSSIRMWQMNCSRKYRMRLLCKVFYDIQI